MIVLVRERVYNVKKKVTIRRIERIHQIPKAVSDVEITYHSKNIGNVNPSILEML